MLSLLDRLRIGQFVSPHHDVISHVNVSSVNVADGGMYRCVATNGEGSVYHEVCIYFQILKFRMFDSKIKYSEKYIQRNIQRNKSQINYKYI